MPPADGAEDIDPDLAKDNLEGRLDALGDAIERFDWTAERAKPDGQNFVEFPPLGSDAFQGVPARPAATRLPASAAPQNSPGSDAAGGSSRGLLSMAVLLVTAASAVAAFMFLNRQESSPPPDDRQAAAKADTAEADVAEADTAGAGTAGEAPPADLRTKFGDWIGESAEPSPAPVPP